ncbi:MAG: hypothetical protein KTR31_08385 [Myxococcales bacterium]|nr:hypothetical protein [Myxococcales bacterium]
MKVELDELVTQLDELLGEPILTEDDALEVAIVAGLAARLGASDSQLEDAVDWRDGMGEDLVESMWEQVDLDPLIAAVDACTTSGADELAVEKALYDVDDVIAAAVWCGEANRVRASARELASIVRMVPETFASEAAFAAKVAVLPGVADHIGLYDYWLALADTAAAS